LGEALHDEAGGHGGKQRHSDWEGGAVTKKAAPNSGDAKTLFRSNLSRARFNKAMDKIANDSFATKSPLVKAAYGESNMRSSNAWNSEFQQALARAEYCLSSTKPVTREDKRALADFLKRLKRLLKRRPRGGAPRLPPLAERAAANLVRERLKAFRKESGKKRISRKSGEPARLIAEAIKEVSIHFSVAPSKISAKNISTLVYKK
jgi:hypothetical protein